ncbi:MAG: hypothetical protein NTZ16_16240 [Verrucomicrobia bacterium]|nr:hypothetical protein [Verrucomicrobiota bacterium]
MKTQLLTLAATLAFFTSSATDRLVHELGLAGAYSTISSAIAASSAGDRILVYPKTGGASYVENPSLSLSNLQLLNAIEGERYKVQGSISVGTNGSVVGAEVNGAISDAGASGSNVHIVNCKVSNGSIYAGTNTGKSWIDNDSVINGYIKFYYGRVSGCYVSGTNQTNGCIELAFGAVISNDTAFIVGNKVESYSNGVSGIAIHCFSLSVYAYVSNNYIVMNSNTSGVGIGVLVTSVKGDPIKSNVLINNTVNTPTLGGAVSFEFDWSMACLVNVRNNISSFSPGGVANITGFANPSGSSPGITSEYNYVNGSIVPFQWMPIGTGNVSSSNSTIDLSTGAINSGGDAINGGDPSPAMLDLDLTRNDAGCYGGSLSRANFTTAETGSRVLWMNAPRFIFSGQGATISGEGVDK